MGSDTAAMGCLTSSLLVLSPVFGALLALVGSTVALPTLQTRAVTPLSQGDLTALTPFAHFAGAVYCNLGQVQAWNCGA